MADDARAELIEYLGNMYAPGYPGLFRDGWGEGDDVIDHLLLRPDLLALALGGTLNILGTSWFVPSEKARDELARLRAAVQG